MKTTNKRISIVLLFLFLLTTSCSKDQNSQFIVDTAVNITVKNRDGVDLLNPDNSVAFQENSVRVFYVKDGKAEEVNEPNLDYPKGFRIYKHESEYRITVFPNDLKSEEFPVTLIQWAEDNVDSIKCEIVRESNREQCVKVWFNDSLSWEIHSNDDRFFEIVK